MWHAALCAWLRAGLFNDCVGDFTVKKRVDKNASRYSVLSLKYQQSIRPTSKLNTMAALFSKTLFVHLISLVSTIRFTVNSHRRLTRHNLILQSCLLFLLNGLLAATTLANSPADNPSYPPQGLIPVCVSAHFYACGLWDRAGQWRIEPQYQEIYENGSMWTVVKHSGMTGLLDAEGKTRIEPRFGEIGTFIEGLAYAKDISASGERYGYIDTQGNWVIKPQFMYPASFKDGNALVWIPGEAAGRDFEDRRLALVNKVGKTRLLPFADADSQVALDGRYVVYQQVQYGTGEPRKIGVADKTGKLIVPWVYAQSIALIPQGGWIVQEAAPSKATVVYARNGREIFRVSGEEAYIYYFKPQSIAVFTQDGHHEGLVNLLTGKVLIKPKAIDLGEVANGLVGFSQPNKNQQTALSGYLDFNGREVIAPSLSYAPAFEGEVVASCSQGAQPPMCSVIARDGHRIAAFDQYTASLINPFAWETGPQEAALRDVMTVSVEGKARADGQVNNTKLLTNQAGQLILRIAQEGECGGEVVRMPDNKVVWPHYPEQTCAVTSIYQQPPTNSPPALLAAYKELQAFERNKTIERAKMVSQGGGIENLLPDAKKARAQFEQLPWVEGPAEITLSGDEAGFRLPAAYRFISAKALFEALAEQPVSENASMIKASDKPEMQYDLIAGPDFRWLLRVKSGAHGYVDLSAGLPPAQELLDTKKVYETGSPFLDVKSADTIQKLMVRWEMEPVLNLKHQRLAYAYGDVINQHVEFNLIRFGRHAEIMFAAKWTSMLTYNDFDTYHDEIMALVDTVEFLPGRTYADHQPEDKNARYDLLKQLVTGPPSVEFIKFSNTVGNAIQRDEEKKQAKMNGLLIKLGVVILALIALLASWLNGRKEKSKTV